MVASNLHNPNPSPTDRLKELISNMNRKDLETMFYYYGNILSEIHDMFPMILNRTSNLVVGGYTEEELEQFKKSSGKFSKEVKKLI